MTTRYVRDLRVVGRLFIQVVVSIYFADQAAVHVFPEDYQTAWWVFWFVALAITSAWALQKK